MKRAPFVESVFLGLEIVWFKNRPQCKMRKVNTKFVLNLNQKTGKFEFKGDFFLLSYYQKGISIHVYMSERGISFEARPTLGLIWVDTSFSMLCFIVHTTGNSISCSNIETQQDTHECSQLQLSSSGWNDLVFQTFLLKYPFLYHLLVVLVLQMLIDIFFYVQVFCPQCFDFKRNKYYRALFPSSTHSYLQGEQEVVYSVLCIQLTKN